MDINIIMLDGTSHVLSVHPEATVGSLKVLIQQTLGVQVESQRLVVNGMNTPLSDDSQPVCSYSLQQGAQVSLLVTQPPTIQVFLRNEKGKTNIYDIKPDETVANFKKMVESRETDEGQGIAVDQQRLIHQGREMMEGKLSDYNVKANSVIELVVIGMNTPLSDDSQPVCSYGLQQGAQVSQPPTQPPTIQVFLRNEKGKTSTYDIKPDETVDNFKRMVESRETDEGQGIPVSQQRLIHQGREMTEGKLSNYNVKAMSAIELNLRLRGG